MDLTEGYMMKFLIAVMMMSFGMASAHAADLAPRTYYTKAPAYVDPGYDWTGFYVGGNVGYSWGRSSDSSTLSNAAGTVLFSSANSSNLDGVIGGGQAGYNWQARGWVWGLEADFQGTGERGSRSFTCGTGVCTPPPAGFFALVIPGPAVTATLDQKIDWFGTVRGRLGVLATPKVLFYATGGLAYGEVDSNLTIGPGTVPAAATARAFSASSTNVGYTVGAGVEGVIGGNWTAKLEYLYVDLGRVSGSFVTTIAASGGGTLVSGFNSRVTDNILRVGVNYKFGGPVVARY
jgi:outer membrane immunogenic protein